jgi:hypothetical protein
MGKLKYNWEEIQKYYDNGHSWRDCIKEFGCANATIAKAVKSGRLKTRTHSEGMRVAVEQNKIFTGPHSEETKEKISKALSLNNKGGRCKWYFYNGQWLQGTWELTYAKYLDLKNIKWKKLGIGDKDHSFEWEDIDGKHHYTPDFYLEEKSQYIEVKGYWWGNDKEKMRQVLSQNDIDLKIVEKKEYKIIKEIVETGTVV